MGISTWVRRTVLIVALVGAVFYLAPPSPPEHHLPNRKIVKFWHMWSGEWQPVVEQICDRFNKSQTEYEVVPLYVPSSDAASKFLLTAAGGETPDLVSQWNPVLGTWTDKGVIQPVEDVMTPAEREKYRKEAYPIFLRNATYRGKIMCLVAGVDTYAAYYRLDHLKEVGRDEHSLPKTMDELVALGEQLDRRDAHGAISRIGFLPQALTIWSPIFGGKFETNPDLLLDTPENERALKFMVSRVDRYGKENVTRFLAAQPSDTGINAPLLTGNYSILIDGQWKVKQTADVAPKGFEYCVAPVPPPVGGLPLASSTNANYLMIPSAAKNPKGALEFMKFWIGFTDPEVGAQNVTDMGWLPYSEAVANSKAYRDYLVKYPQFATFVDLVRSPHLEIAPLGPIQSYVADQIQKADDAAMAKSLSPEAALKKLQNDVIQETEHQRRLGNVK